MENIQDIQADRAKTYGEYSINCKTRGEIMKLLYEANVVNNIRTLNCEEFVMLSDIVSKLVRYVTCPDHEDSRVDLESYANLLNKYYTKSTES